MYNTDQIINLLCENREMLYNVKNEDILEWLADIEEAASKSNSNTIVANAGGNNEWKIHCTPAPTEVGSPLMTFKTFDILVKDRYVARLVVNVTSTDDDGTRKLDLLLNQSLDGMCQDNVKKWIRQQVVYNDLIKRFRVTDRDTLTPDFCYSMHYTK